MVQICKTKKEINLVEGSTRVLVRKMILFTIPIVLVGILQLLYTAFDLIVVQGHDGSLAAASVGANGSLIGLITSGFLGLSNGVSVVIARFYGRNDKKNGNKSAHTALLLAFVGGLMIGIFGFAFSKFFLQLMKVDVSYIDMATKYLKIYFLGMPFLATYNFGTAIFSSTGNSVTPLMFLIVTGILNIFLNYLFVYGFNWSVAGVAYATVISEAVSAILVIVTLFLNKGFIQLRRKEFVIDNKILKEILKIGVPSGLQGVIFSISNVILQTSVNSWGPEVVAANSDASSIEGLTYTAMFAVSSTSTAFTSANYARGYKDNIKKIQITTLVMVGVIGLVLGLVTILFSRQLLSFYMGNNSDKEVESYALLRLFVILSTYWLCGFMDVECGILRGLGYSLSPLLVTLCSCCLFRIIWDYFVYSDDVSSSMHNLGILYACYPISWSLAFIIEFSLYKILGKKFNKRIDDNRKSYEENQPITNALIENKVA